MWRRQVCTASGNWSARQGATASTSALGALSRCNSATAACRTTPIMSASIIPLSTLSSTTSGPIFARYYASGNAGVSSKATPVDHFAPTGRRSERAGAATDRETVGANTDAAPDTVPSSLSGDVLFHNLTVADVLKNKKRNKELATVNENESTFNAIAKMAELNIGAIMVKDSEGKIAGIFTERDYMTKVVVKGLSSKQVPVGQLMTRKFHWIGDASTVMDCMRIMTSNKFRHLPVHNHLGEVVGIVSIGDLVVSILQEYHDALEYYKSYIDGSYSIPRAPSDDIKAMASSGADRAIDNP